ncbi:aldose 1-epimerase family protein [Nocardioides sp.]|uniref:aldose 1-epimerase family protein n=1 Tax=Nocardioides sp. TaxID=35761 RepID=UPI0035278FF4
MVAATGEQYLLEGGGYRAVVTEGGAVLRSLEYAGRPLVDGFAEAEIPRGCRGQLLIPWPNRIRDGAYTFDGVDQQLPLTEPARRNASHGLVRWSPWNLEEHTDHSVVLTHRLMAQYGYPWTLDLHAVYDVSADGLTVTLSATNLSPQRAPYAVGAHPYLLVGDAGIDGLELTLPAATRLLVDDRQLPMGREPVDGTDYDFRMPRPIRDTVFDHGFTDLTKDPAGGVTVSLRDPATGHGVALWGDHHVSWLQVFSQDDGTATARRAIAVEPMTAPADAFNSGDDLHVLAPAGDDGDTLSVAWGLRALE